MYTWAEAHPYNRLANDGTQRTCDRAKKHAILSAEDGRNT